ncbi:MAG: hypothetical protein JST38_06620 [Bacteroidetes bacterium]|nr:hypothetical protein [Bacteroidota bacterium]
MQLKRVTPFRVAAILFMSYQLVRFIRDTSNFTSTGGSSWGGVAIIASLFWGAVLWLIDVLMRRSIQDGRIIWGIQLLLLLAMYLFLDW